jgi:hypothetical protein
MGTGPSADTSLYSRLHALSDHSIVIGLGGSTQRSHPRSFISCYMMNEMTPSVFPGKNGRRKKKESTLCLDMSHFRALDFKMNTQLRCAVSTLPLRFRCRPTFINVYSHLWMSTTLICRNSWRWLVPRQRIVHNRWCSRDAEFALTNAMTRLQNSMLQSWNAV